MKFYETTKKITLSLFLAFVLCLIGTSNVEAKTYCSKSNKVKSCYVGKTKNNWIKRTKTYFSRKNYTTKYRTKDTYVKRTSSKKVTYSRARTFYNGGKKLKTYAVSDKYIDVYKGYKSYGKPLYKREANYYKYSKYTSKGAKYYEYIIRRDKYGNLEEKEILKSGVRKKYKYTDIGTDHYITYQFKNNKWVIAWQKNYAKVIEVGYDANVVDMSKNMYIYVVAKSGSSTDKANAYKYAKSVADYALREEWQGYWMPQSGSWCYNSKTKKWYIYIDFSRHEGNTQTGVYAAHDKYGIKDHTFPVIILK